MIDDHMPVAAVDWIIANDPVTDRSTSIHGAAIWACACRRTRFTSTAASDIYGDAPIREFADAVQLRTDPQELFDKYEIDYVSTAWIRIRRGSARAREITTPITGQLSGFVGQ